MDYKSLDNFIFQNILQQFLMRQSKAYKVIEKILITYTPFNLILPNSISAISSILGFQFLILFIIFKNKRNKYFINYNYFNNYPTLLSKYE